MRQWLVTLALAGFLVTFPVGLVLPLFVGPTDWAGVLFVGGMLSLLVGFVLAGGVPKNVRTRQRAGAPQWATAETGHLSAASPTVSPDWPNDVVNPATGLSMMGGVGGVDTAGNPYGGSRDW